MRIERFQSFITEALAKAPGVQGVEPWTEDDRPYGVLLTLTSGARAWAALAVALAAGEKLSHEESPTEGPIADPVSWPALLDGGGQTSPTALASYLAAATVNAGHPEVAAAEPYGEGKHPGFATAFHSGAKGFFLLVHTARAGQNRGGRAYDLQGSF